MIELLSSDYVNEDIDSLSVKILNRVSDQCTHANDNLTQGTTVNYQFTTTKELNWLGVDRDHQKG